MPKIVIDTTNVSKEEVQELKNYLEQNCWSWFGEVSSSIKLCTPDTMESGSTNQ